jgi:hypothetical protein
MHRRSDKTLDDLARMINPHIRGWINYYGHFYRSAPLLQVGAILDPEPGRRRPGSLGARQVQTPAPEAKARKGLAGTGSPGKPKPLRALALCACRRRNIGSRMTREGHVRF